VDPGGRPGPRPRGGIGSRVTRSDTTPGGRRPAPAASAPRRIAAALSLLVLVVAAPLLANGGIVRISGAPVGPWLVTVYSSPTPLRTGEVDISVLVQDSAESLVDVPIAVEASPLGIDGASAVREVATRAAATNKLFKAAKFEIADPGEWEFRVRVGGGAAEGPAGADRPEDPPEGPGRAEVAGGGGGGAVSFRATVARTTILDRPYLLAAIILLPLALTGWLLWGGDDDDTDARERPTG
jgi:hypothetical protein